MDFSMFLILFLVFTAVILAGLYFLLKKFSKTEKPEDKSLLLLQNQINELNRTLDSRLKENRESFERTTQNLGHQFSNFTGGITKIDEELKKLSESVGEVTSFQQIFRTPKLRGRWGELALEHILSQYFPREMFILQYPFKSGEAVDAILKLPDGKLLPIDAKFPHEHFERMIESANENEKEIAKKSFAIEIKREIDDISKKYILPSEGTTNIAVLYIPAEAVYFEIINSLPEVVDYARSKKIILSSPNTFYLILQTIQHWSRDLQIGRKTQDFIKKMSRIITDAQKLGESFDKLGKHLRDVRSSYEESDKRLELLQERTEKLVELETEEINQLEKPKQEIEE